ncbi:MAG: hypothetical protein WC780_16625 [Lentimicrobiaceae bacterium]
MVMIGGNSRNSGKTTMACNIISRLSASQEVIGLKVTSIRPGEYEMHGNHSEEDPAGFTIFEELNPVSHKDTSKMLSAGATHVYYIRATEVFIEKAILHFLERYINKQFIVCESRSLRGIIVPGLFLMMMRIPEENTVKESTTYISKADQVFYFVDDQTEKIEFVANLHFANGKFIWNK